jgi:hypothetical protein
MIKLHKIFLMKKDSDHLLKLLFGIILSLGMCFSLQAYFRYVLDMGTGKSESNYFSTMSRFQAGASPAAEIALAGSSITGRLPGRESGNQGIANLGSDGGPALDGIRLIVMNQINAPKWLVIEANTLYGGVGYGETLIVKGAQGPWFDVGVRLPLLGAASRPSGMLYAKMLGRSKVLSGEAFECKLTTLAPEDGNLIRDFTDGEKERLEEYVSALLELQRRGVKFLVVTYPAGAMREREKFLMQKTIAEFARRIPISCLNLEEQLSREELQFTDSVHLGPQSAARVLQTIRKFCK